MSSLTTDTTSEIPINTTFIEGKQYSLHNDVYTILKINKAKTWLTYSINNDSKEIRKKIHYNNYELCEYIYPFSIKLFVTGIGQEGMNRNILYSKNIINIK